ncbi:PITH domain-containing protein P35G2.02 [Leucoagaricus sp. SymC.cos]|nr:PITH domain-containing protein P35G2.02 [Leucoagaricus sp. SymC.cos]
MPHEHNHSHCHNESHNHDHDHDTGDLGPQDSLYIHIDRPNVVALNAVQKGHVVIKPWDKRLDEGEALESDADDQMIIRVPFTGSVRLRSVLLKTGPGDKTPRKVKLFANEENMDFDDTGDRAPTQEFDVAPGREVGEYAVKTVKFSNVSSLTLYFPEGQGADTIQIYYLGFLGHWTERKNNPVITVYEAQANPADHSRIQGTDGNFSTPQT